MLGNNDGVGLGQNQAFLGFRPEEYQETTAFGDEIIYISRQQMYNSLAENVRCVWSKFEDAYERIIELWNKSEVEGFLSKFMKGIVSTEIDLAFKIYRFKDTKGKVKKIFWYIFFSKCLRKSFTRKMFFRLFEFD